MQLIEQKAVNVATVPQLSPFRYPGGKTWLIPWIRAWLKSIGSPLDYIVEPFAGGGAVSLASVHEGLVNKAILIERDEAIGAVWRTIFSDRAPEFAERVAAFSCTPIEVAGLMASRPKRVEDIAFKTLVSNRTRYGGILADGAALVKHGENGRGVASRWYPETLRKRIMAVASHRHRIRFIPGDGLRFLERMSRMRNAVAFIDPPYTVAGRRLYKYSDIDHAKLFQTVSQLRFDFLMTYDNAAEIRSLALKHRFEVEEIPMKSTKHELKLELLIGRDLSWARRRLTVQLGNDAVFEVS